MRKIILLLLSFTVITALHAQTIDMSFSDLPNGSVLVTTITDNYIYVGGTFTHIGNFEVSKVARYHRKTGKLDTLWVPPAIGHSSNYSSVYSYTDVSTIAATQNDVIIGGQFTAVGNLERIHIAKLSAKTAQLDPLWNPGVGNFTNWLTLQNTVLAKIAILENSVFIGGKFTKVGGLRRINLAKVSLTNGQTDVAWNPEPSGFENNNYIQGFEVDGNYMYIFGNFFKINNQDRKGVAKIDIITGVVDPNWDPEASNNSISDLKIENSYIYITGQFNTIGGKSRFGIGRVDKITGDADEWNPNPVGFFPALIAVGKNHIYLTGILGEIGGKNGYIIAKIGKSDGLAPPNWDFPNVNNSAITAINYDINNERLFVGGYFTDPQKHLLVIIEKSQKNNPLLHLRASTITGSDLESISMWNDLEGNDDNAEQIVPMRQPVLKKNNQVVFNYNANLQFGKNRGMIIEAHPELSGGLYKTMFVVLRTGLDVVSRQMILDLGGTNSGFNMYIQGFQIYGGVWNGTDSWHISRQILPNRVYLIQCVYDGASIKLSVNGVNGSVSQTWAGIKFTNQNISGSDNLVGIGCVADLSRYHNGYCFSAFGDSFLGEIAEVHVINSSDIQERDAVFNELDSIYAFKAGFQPIKKELDVDAQFVTQKHNNDMLYPNPANYILNFTGSYAVTSWEIRTIEGVKVKENYISDQNGRFDISVRDLSEGYYYIVVTTEEGSYVYPFVKLIK